MEDLEVLTLENIPNNSFLIIKVDVPGPMEKFAAANQIACIIKPYKKIFEDKNISIIILTPKENLSILTESDMNLAGWFKKV